ncbi:hypothetical protein [Kitasatospora sp. NPDC056184]|uniref:hypothetical protein n=1 Tax=Kitasatospora sp. NPDC056184 TaxID=3345738 RepID=UPI0035DDC599
MRVRAGLALAMVLLVGTVACGAGGGDRERVASAGSGKPTATATASKDAGKDAGKGTAADFAKCMRDNGVPEFPDPEANGSMVVPEGTDKSKIDAAHTKCKDKAPNGGEPPKTSAEDQEKLRRFAQCMRSNGLPGFPDPDPNSSGMMLGQDSGLDPESAAFKAAEEKCRQFQPDALNGARPGGKAAGARG